MKHAGYTVALSTDSFRVPDVCVGCEGTPTTKIRVDHYQSSTRTRRWADLPYCATCAKKRSGNLSARRLTFVGVFFLTAGFAFFGVVLPTLPMVALALVPVGFAVAAGLLAGRLAAARVPAELVTMSGPRAFFCVNVGFANRFAAANETTATQATLRESFGTTVAISCAIVTAGLSTWVAFATNPPVYFDNAGNKPVQIWLDGEKLLVVEPTKGREKRTMVRIPFGKHELAWSPTKASKPKDTSKVEVEWSGNHLYNPGKTACYYLEARVYGQASAKGLQRGPLALASFYSFKRVDSWFEGLPTSVRSKASGETRVGLTLYGACERLPADCPTPVRAKLMSCAQEAWADGNEVAVQKCLSRAVNACGAETPAEPPTPPTPASEKEGSDTQE